MEIFRKTYFSKQIELENNTVTDVFSGIDYANISNDGYMVQGLVFAKEYLVISAYHKIVGRQKDKSRLYFYNKKTGIYCGHVELDNSAHVGGVAFDSKNGILFVTGSRGKVNAYSFESLIRKLNKNGKMIKYDSSSLNISLVLDGNVSAATIYFYEGYLYVATCSNIGRVVRYKIRYNKNMVLIDGYKIFNNAPACIQGLCVFRYEEKLYYLFSQSYSKLPSTIKVLDENFNFIGQVTKCITGIEGIDISKEGSVYAVFENSVTKIYDINLCKFSYKKRKCLEKKYISYGRLHQNILDAASKNTI